MNKDNLSILYSDLIKNGIVEPKKPEPKRLYLVDGAEWFDHYGTHYACDGKIQPGDSICSKCGAVLEWEELK